MRKYFIYKLANPIDNTIFYIGITCNNLESRLSGHIAESLREKKTKKHVLICEILSLGMRPIIDLIEENECEISKVLRKEKYWIGFYKNAGCPLTNIQCTAGRYDVPCIDMPNVARVVYGEVIKYINNKKSLLDLEQTATFGNRYLDKSFPQRQNYNKREIEMLAQQIILDEVRIVMTRTIGDFVFGNRDYKTGDLIKDYKLKKQ